MLRASLDTFKKGDCVADTLTYLPDALNRITSVTNLAGELTQYQYYPDNQLKQVTYPSNIEAKYRYNSKGLLASLTNSQDDGATLLSSYGYIYDDNGNRTQQTEINGAGSEITDYVFDEEDRLQHVTYPETKVTYGYDLNYNRISETEIQLSDNSVIKQQKSHYNSRNQLTHIDDQLDSANNITYHYDDNGNQISKVKAAETTNFIVNARDEIEKITIGGSTVGQFLYDHKGLRIQKIGEQGNVRYTYDDASVLLQTDTDNSLLASYQYGPNRLLSLKQTGKEAEYYLFDALGSPVNLTTAAGEITARYQYDAWGHKRNETSTSWNRFGFTGHEEDKETGLIYAKARYYDPDTGRFLSQDAFEGFDNRPPSLHKYLYAYGNPVYYTDPDGNASVIASGQEIDQFGYELYLSGNHVGAAGIAILGAAYKVGTGFFTLGQFDQINQAITNNDSYAGATKQYGAEVVDSANDAAKEYLITTFAQPASTGVLA